MRYAMSFRFSLFLLMVLFIASSCATKKEVRTEEPAPPERIEVINQQLAWWTAFYVARISPSTAPDAAA